MPANIRKMAKAIMHNPVEVQIAISRPPESIRQMAVDIFETQKTALLVRLLGDEAIRRLGNKAPQKSTDFSGTPLAIRQEAKGERREGERLTKVIIFVGKKQRVKDLTRALRANHINARAMHSDLEQKERDEVMLDFRNGKVDVLVATDIVSRGIDVDDIPLVINYDVPHDAEDYVHRIGRTARAANKGEAITLVSPDDKRFMNKIERFLKKTIDRVALPDDLGPAPDSSVCSLAADERKPSSKRRKGGWHGGQNRKPKKNRPASHKQ
jgi:superfamily II DNA/RNA helicase